jgi:hypothetical protein
MRILVVDPVPAACATLARGLRETIGCETLCASSTVEAIRRLQIEKDTIGIIIFFLETGPEAGLSFIRTIRESSEAVVIRPPSFLVLTPGPLTDGYIWKFRNLRVECLLYGFPLQVYETARGLVSDALRETGRPTIVVDRSGPITKFYLRGPSGMELIGYGPRLVPMMNYFAINFGTELSTAMLAEAADITNCSVRVYLKRLRDRYDEARVKVGVDILGRSVFCTMRKDGAFVHVLKTRTLFN